MDSLLPLTHFESQVLQAIEASLIHRHIAPGKSWSFGPYAEACWIHPTGQKMFGKNWGGSRHSTHLGFTHPTIDAALGRLRRKGYVTSLQEEAVLTNRSSWFLTPLAAHFLGLDPNEAFVPDL